MVTTRRTCPVLTFILLCLSLSGCPPEVEIVEVPLDAPLERLVVRGNEFIFYPAANSTWQELAAIELFENFRPSMTLEQAEECMGAPSEKEDDTYAAYDRPQGLITLSYESDKSWGATFSTWRLRLYPAASSLEAILHPALVTELRDRMTDPMEVVIMNSDHEGPALSARVREGQVESITWHRFGRIEEDSPCL